jgi:hypothetical protein
MRIIAGDFAKGEWKAARDGETIYLKGPNRESVKLTGEVSSVEHVTEEEYKSPSFATKGTFAALGLAAFGPLGAIAGLVFSGNNKNSEIVIVVRLKSGKKFMGVTSKSGYVSWKSLTLG